ncbi:DUF551 domain-containing protein [Enterobacter hormaechei]|uniref:DUF551 domain-containing protein n=7 Tax=Enterobacteriaceae TaxID=543 RepID=UPI00235FB2D3|nr:DUF551 domain-containing protein [Enterobacter hormaechei]MDC9827665.1 DUF551 domain-containing protein [Enterobacter hormaechei subsp. steigerwaltii]
MSTITKERIEQYANDPRMCNVNDEIRQIALIALASLEAEAVGEVSEQRDGLVMDGMVDLGGASTHRIIKGASKMKRLPLGTKFYTAPPAPANAEPVAWLWSHRKHPSEVTLVRPEDDERAEGAHWSGWSCQALYAAQPASAAMKDHQIRELVNELRDIAVEYHGTQQLRERIARTIRAAMLQGADGTLTNEGTIPVTQFKPVADLYGLTSPTGGETSFTFDAVEARDFIDGGWSCQEYVELGRFQEAMLQNGNSPAQSDCCPEQNYIAPAQEGDSPVLPDGWVACSERMPEVGVKVLCFPVNDEPIHATYNGQVWLQDISWSVSDEPIDNVISCNVFHWMPLPAAPQQEADNE